MGPADNISDMSTTNPNNQKLFLPMLKGDSSNWATYLERILNYLTSKGFCRHVQGTARKPETLIERDGLYYKPSSLAKLEKREGIVDTQQPKKSTSTPSATPQPPPSLTEESGCRIYVEEGHINSC